jgi:hypothetical protein
VIENVLLTKSMGKVMYYFPTSWDGNTKCRSSSVHSMLLAVSDYRSYIGRCCGEETPRG